MLPGPRADSSVAVLISPGVPVFVERILIPNELAEDLAAADGVDVAEWSDI